MAYVSDPRRRRRRVTRREVVRRSMLAVLGLAVLLVLQACGGDGAGTAPADGGTGNGGEGSTVEISAQGNAFDADTITVPAGASVLVRFTNEEAVPHNVAFYESGQASSPEVGEKIFVGDVVSGPDETIEYEFEAPTEPGEYFFRCDLHPAQMTGSFIVE